MPPWGLSYTPWEGCLSTIWRGNQEMRSREIAGEIEWASAKSWWCRHLRRVARATKRKATRRVWNLRPNLRASSGENRLAENRLLSRTSLGLEAECRTVRRREYTTTARGDGRLCGHGTRRATRRAFGCNGRSASEGDATVGTAEEDDAERKTEREWPADPSSNQTDSRRRASAGIIRQFRRDWFGRTFPEGV